MVFHCKTFIRLSLLEIHLPPSFSFIKPGSVQCPPSIFTPIIPEHSKEETLSPPLTFQNIFQCVLPLCYYIYPFALSAMISSSFSITLYTEGEMKWKLFFFFFRSPDSYHRSLIWVQFSIYWQAGPRSSQADSYFTPTPAILISRPWPLTHCHQAQSYEMDEVCLQEHKLSWFGGLFLSFKVLKSFAFDHKWKPVVFSVLSELLASTNRSGGGPGGCLWPGIIVPWIVHGCWDQRKPSPIPALLLASSKAVASDLPSLSQPTSPH